MLEGNFIEGEIQLYLAIRKALRNKDGDEIVRSLADFMMTQELAADPESVAQIPLSSRIN